VVECPDGGHPPQGEIAASVDEKFREVLQEEAPVAAGGQDLWVVSEFGGSGGGQVIAVGSPEEIALHPKSYTGMFLKQFLNGE